MELQKSETMKFFGSTKKIIESISLEVVESFIR